MKKLLLDLMFYFYRDEYYKPLSKVEVEGLLIKLATTSGLEDLPRYLGQLADSARNQYLYSKDDIFKGSILAFTTLREQIVQKQKPIKKKLTQEEEVGIMRKRGY